MKITPNNVLGGHLKIAKLSDQDLLILMSNCDKSMEDPNLDSVKIGRIKIMKFKVMDEMNRRKSE